MRGVKIKLVDFAIYLFLALFVGIFLGVVCDRVFAKDCFNKEFIIKVQPMGYSQYPYEPYHQYFTTLPYENHKVTIRNGNVVSVRRIGYTFKEK